MQNPNPKKNYEEFLAPRANGKLKVPQLFLIILSKVFAQRHGKLKISRKSD
jgi:hypothetical protein